MALLSSNQTLTPPFVPKSFLEPILPTLLS
jgi:hypothetical protein